ncbi:hypothetical protein DLH97_07300 [Vibrio parahaemolyticus]|nr:hypothetical protein [Vibrio parahaemolyticus]EGR2872008.1 hypothetical protein [Vibrio parahaemolyticus]
MDARKNGEASWQTPDSSQFIPANLKRTMGGKAPRARFKDTVGRKTFFLNAPC